MKITINDFGPINHFEFDSEKDLHLIYGKNAVGKSYVSELIYIILKNFKSLIYYKENDLISKKQDELYKFAEKIFQKLLNGEIDKFYDITNEIEDFFSNIMFEENFEEFNTSIKNSFSSEKNLKNRYTNKDYFFGLEFQISELKEKDIFEKKYEMKIHELLNKKNISLKFYSENGFITSSKIKFNHKIKMIKKYTKTSKYSIYIDRKLFTTSLKVEFIENFVYFLRKMFDIIFSPLDNIFFKELYFLPASRSGLNLGLENFTPILMELSQKRYLLKNQKIDLFSLPEPISDYYLKYSTFNSDEKNEKLENIITELENEVLKGKIVFDKEKNKPYFYPNKLNLKLEMYESSSMVAELTPLIIFLKYIIKNNSKSLLVADNLNILQKYLKNKFLIYFLFIEEPEVHLHPEIQVKLMEIFVKLISLGIKVIITSHSNYMMEKLTNMILDKKVDYQKVAVYHLIKTDKGTIINKDMTVSDEGIMDYNFLDTTKNLYEERMEILEKDE